MKIGVIAFAFGTPFSISPNVRIACIARKKARELNASIYTQQDVRLITTSPVEYTDEEHNNPPPTLRIARGAIKWAVRNGIQELWVVAAKPHAWRAMRDLRMARREAGASIEINLCLEEIDQYPADSWFSLDSTQERTRTHQAWRNRELILRYLPFWIYKRVAS